MNRKTKPSRNRTTVYRVFIAIAMIVSLIACNGSDAPLPPFSQTPPSELRLSLSEFAQGLANPTGLYNAGVGDPRLFVIEQAGRIKVLQPDGTVLPTAFLDITDRVTSRGETGLLGLAFHPAYATNGLFYVNYTNTTNGTLRTRISLFSVTSDPNIADPNSEEILLTVDQPFANHNAGDIHFGPDGYLYIPLGDGGGGGDLGDNAQTLTTLLGKIARIDVDSGPGGAPPDCVGQGAGNYTIPPDNPLVNGQGGTCDETWAIGLRNPFRSSFDRLTGDFYIGDVGQDLWEEIDVQPGNSSGGENYGWRCYEGNHAFNTLDCGPAADYTFPIFEYSHDEGCSVSGGYVYRGTKYPAMQGHYLLTDYCSGKFRDLIRNDSGEWIATLHTLPATSGFASFGEDSDGEVYVVNNVTGIVYRVQAE
jgi:glucose/arabinose dehydrogenase